jgi:hypothetical protein
VPRTLQRRRDHCAGRRFLGNRDSIFEIQDHRIGIE